LASRSKNIVPRDEEASTGLDLFVVVIVNFVFGKFGRGAVAR
jgi:hypothetical protein